MDFGFTEEQEMIRKMAREFLIKECPKALVKEMAKDEKGHPVELWQKMAKLGWMGLALPEEYEGANGSFFDLVILLEEMGRACLPGPFFSTVVLGGLTILEAGSKEQKQELLPKLAQGNLTMTLALTEPSAKYTAEGIQVKATPSGNGFSIQGTKLFVPDAHVADYLICVAKTKKLKRVEDGITLFLLEGNNPAIRCVLLKTIAGDKQCEVTFDNAPVTQKNILGEVGKGWYSIEKVLEKAAIARCAEVVGGMKQSLEMTLDYAKQRIQFGRPIGSFQAIQHYCANMAMDVDASSLITYQAAWRLSKELPASDEVAMAKAWTSNAFKRLTAQAHQIHGAIGFTEDHNLPLYHKRSKAWELSFGEANFWLDKLATSKGF